MKEDLWGFDSVKIEEDKSEVRLLKDGNVIFRYYPTDPTTGKEIRKIGEKKGA